MAQKFRVRELSIISQANNDSWLVLENIWTSTPVTAASVPLWVDINGKVVVTNSSSWGIAAPVTIVDSVVFGWWSKWWFIQWHIEADDSFTDPQWNIYYYLTYTIFSDISPTPWTQIMKHSVNIWDWSDWLSPPVPVINAVYCQILPWNYWLVSSPWLLNLKYYAYT